MISVAYKVSARQGTHMGCSRSVTSLRWLVSSTSRAARPAMSGGPDPRHSDLERAGRRYSIASAPRRLPTRRMMLPREQMLSQTQAARRRQEFGRSPTPS
jgi:hypothetical protein